MIIGVDEVGRGCWAGPLCVGAVGFDDTFLVEGLDDSKKLTREVRQRLSLAIKGQARYVGIGWVQPSDIDRLGMTKALCIATDQALAGLGSDYQKIIIDGNFAFSKLPRVEVLPKADALVPQVSAASIIAKVARDDYMRAIATLYPRYQFERHVGYGTLLHRQALAEHGPSVIHRRSYKPIQALLV